jgi:uncharacterized protein (DUF2132 family)
VTAPATDPSSDNTSADGAPAGAVPSEAPAARELEAQPRNPLHGVTLEAIINALAAEYDWSGLGERINIRCFTKDADVSSSLKFLRKTPWAREKVESLYLYMLREQRRQQQYDNAMAKQARLRG